MSDNLSLTQKQRTFCEEYLTDFNGTQACIRAGYSKKSSEAQASRMLKNVKVKAFLDKEIQKRSIRTGITSDKVLQELAKIAFSSVKDIYDKDGRMLQPHELDDDVAASISGFKTRIEGNVNTDSTGEAKGFDVIEEYKRYDKVKTLELLGKHLGMFTEKIDGGAAQNDLTIEIE